MPRTCGRIAMRPYGVGRWIPHSFASGSVSHHHLPARSSSPGLIARVHGAHPMLGNPLSCSLLYGTCCLATYFRTSCIVQFASGLILNESCLVSCSTTAISDRFMPWSLRSPVIHASASLSALSSGWTFRMLQQSFRFSMPL